MSIVFGPNPCSMALILALWPLQYKKDVIRLCNEAFEGMFQVSSDFIGEIVFRKNVNQL